MGTDAAPVFAFVELNQPELCPSRALSAHSHRSGMRNAHIAGRDSRLMENAHPAQESLRDAVGAFPGIFRFTADAGGSGGPGCETVCLFRQWRRLAGTGGVRGLCPVRRGLAGSLDCLWISPKKFCFRRVSVIAGPGFSLMRKNILGQQPPKQPLAQNKNGSRFVSLASY